MKQQLRIAPGLELDPDYVGAGTLALLAKKGAGKSYTGRVLAEEFWRTRVPFVAIDPMGAMWGLRSSADGAGEGLPIPIFGGKHGDAPLERTAGALMADLVVDEGLSMILDLEGFGSRAAERQFALDFFERLYRRNDQLVHLLVDEADLFAPQKPQSGDHQLLGATENIVRRGRNKGIGVTLMTQRPAVLNKDVLTQIDGLVAMRIVGLTDREAVDKWVEGHGDDVETAHQVKSSLAGLANGECWWWIPELGILKRVQVRASHTFDSSPSRKRGERRRGPKTVADVDLQAVEQKMAATIERARAEDPKELRKQIAQLRRQLTERPTEKEVETVTEKIEVPVVSTKDLARLRAIVDKLATAAQPVERGAAAMLETVSKVEAIANPAPRVERRPPQVRPAPARPADSQPERSSRPENNGEVQLKAGARRMLQAMASLHPAFLTRAQVGALSRVKHSGGTFNSYLSTLRGAGLIEEQGKELRLSESGLELIGGAPEPLTTDELLAMWRSRLKLGARRMLDVLVDAYPDYVTREELAQAAEITLSGGTFNSYLSTLRRAALIEEQGSHVRAAETLFLGSPA